MNRDDLARALRGLRDEREAGDDHIVVLVKAVKAGRITALECQMPICSCPDGREHFDRRGWPRNGPWAPSADRWPIPGREGGQYRADNVRLAHRFCNQADGGRIGGSRGRGVRHVLSVEGRAALVRRGEALAEISRSPEGRERSRQMGLRIGALGGSLGGPARARRAATPESRAALLRALELGRQTHDQLSSNAVKANCVRWAIGRGKPCTCGTHV